MDQCFFWVRNFALLLLFSKEEERELFSQDSYFRKKGGEQKKRGGNKWAVLGLVLSLSWKSLSRALLDSHHALLHWLLFFHTRQQLCLWPKSRTCWLALNIISPGRWNCCHAGLLMPARFANIAWFRLVRFLFSRDWIATEVKSLGLFSCDWIATAVCIVEQFWRGVEVHCDFTAKLWDQESRTFLYSNFESTRLCPKIVIAWF